MELTIEQEYSYSLGDLLTEREIQVLQGVADGLTSKKIGARLTITESTVKTHVRRIFRKLGARDRVHALRLGFELGYLKAVPGVADPYALRLSRIHAVLRKAQPMRNEAPLGSRYAELYDAIEAALAAQPTTT